jgi:hypothetical protein
MSIWKMCGGVLRCDLNPSVQQIMMDSLINFGRKWVLSIYNHIIFKAQYNKE